MLLRALPNQTELRLVTDRVADGDVFALALVCRELRDAIFTRFAPQVYTKARFQTSLRPYLSNTYRLQWAFSAGASKNRNTCIMAARAGHLATLQWLRANRCKWNPRAICRAAAESGNLEVLQWARDNGCHWNSDTCMSAARSGHLSVLQWARAQGCAWDFTTCRAAAKGGHLVVLQWAIANGCPTTQTWQTNGSLQSIAEAAAEFGQVEVLQWVEQCVGVGQIQLHRICEFAAKGGHLEVLQWARANGRGLYGSECQFAAAKGHLHVLQWAYENGFPLDLNSCMESANRNGHRAVYRWLQRHSEV